jgi:hypothetical protein
MAPVYADVRPGVLRYGGRRCTGGAPVAGPPQSGPCLLQGMALFASEVVDPTLFPPVQDHVEALDGRSDTAQGPVREAGGVLVPSGCG